MAARFRPSGQVPTLSNTDKALDAQKNKEKNIKQPKTKTNNKNKKATSNIQE